MQELTTEYKDKRSLSSDAYLEVQIGNTLYCVTSVYTGEKELGTALEELAVRRAAAESA